MKLSLTRLLVIIVLAAVWEYVARLHLIDPDFFTGPSTIVVESLRFLNNDAIMRGFYHSLFAVAIAFILAVWVGVIIGIPIGLSGYLHSVFHPIIVMAFAMPQVVIFPLFLRFLGIGATVNIAFGFSHGVFPILLNVMAGVRDIDPMLVTASQSMGASRLQIIWKVIMPAMVPSMITGFRLGMGLTLLGVLLSELFVSQGGVGHYIQLFTDGFETGRLFAMIGVLSLMAIAINELLRAIERRLGRWAEA